MTIKALIVFFVDQYALVVRIWLSKSRVNTTLSLGTLVCTQRSVCVFPVLSIALNQDQADGVDDETTERRSIENFNGEDVTMDPAEPEKLPSLLPAGVDGHEMPIKVDSMYYTHL
jgi:hypothetical protein